MTDRSEYFARLAAMDPDAVTIGDMRELHQALRDGDLLHVDSPQMQRLVRQAERPAEGVETAMALAEQAFRAIRGLTAPPGLEKAMKGGE